MGLVIFIYLVLCSISISLLHFLIGVDEFGEILWDGPNVLLMFIFSPFIAISVTLYKMLQYFTPEKRHQRRLAKIRRAKELWEERHGISYDYIEEFNSLESFEEDSVQETT